MSEIREMMDHTLGRFDELHEQLDGLDGVGGAFRGLRGEFRSLRMWILTLCGLTVGLMSAATLLMLLLLIVQD